MQQTVALVETRPAVRLGENLKRLRERAPASNGKRLSQVALGERAGVPQNQISKYERGEAMPEVDTLLKLAAALNVSIETLVEGVDVRFDAMYQGLTVSIRADGPDDARPSSANCGPSVAGPAPSDVIPIEELIPGAPAAVAEAATNEPPTYPDVASAHAALRRIAADIMAVAACIAPGPFSVVRDLGSEVRARDARRRTRTRESHAPKTAQKRR